MGKRLFSLCLFLLCLCGAAFTTAANAPPGLRKAATFELRHAIVLGLVEGVTEYLPVSSTGHLLLAQHMMGLTETAAAKEAADAYAIIIQIGAILAVLGLYRARIGQMLRGLAGRDRQGLHLLFMLLLAFMPAAVVGLAFGDTIKAHLFGPWPIVIGWLAGALAILAKSWGSGKEGVAGLPSVEDVRWRQALAIGLFQVFALWPGISRSLATIIGGLIAGVGLAAAVEFSFLLGLVTLGAATFYEMLGHGAAVVTAYGLALPVVGVLCSFVAAWLSVKWLVAYLQKRGLALFGYYRLVLAAVTAGLLINGYL